MTEFCSKIQVDKNAHPLANRSRAAKPVTLPKVILSKAAWKLLKVLAADPDGELTCEGLSCYTDDDQSWHPRTVMQLLRYCLIRLDPFCKDSYKIYTLNEEGRTLANNPEYRPLITGVLVGLALT